MGDVISFVAGCLFTLCLGGGCLWLAFRLVGVREPSERQEKPRPERQKDAARMPAGVIRPKTKEEMDKDYQEQLKAFGDLLVPPSQDRE